MRSAEGDLTPTPTEVNRFGEKPPRRAFWSVGAGGSCGDGDGGGTLWGGRRPRATSERCNCQHSVSASSTRDTYRWLLFGDTTSGRSDEIDKFVFGVANVGGKLCYAA